MISQDKRQEYNLGTVIDAISVPRAGTRFMARRRFVQSEHPRFVRMKEVLAEGMEVYLGDCRDILPALPIVDLVVTSPPYAQQRQNISFSGADQSLVGCLKDTPSHTGTQIL